MPYPRSYALSTYRRGYYGKYRSYKPYSSRRRNYSTRSYWRKFSTRKRTSRRRKRVQHYYTVVINGNKVRAPKLGYVQLVSRTDPKVERYVTEAKYWENEQEIEQAFVSVAFNAVMYAQYLSFFANNRGRRSFMPSVAQANFAAGPAQQMEVD